MKQRQFVLLGAGAALLAQMPKEARRAGALSCVAEEGRLLLRFSDSADEQDIIARLQRFTARVGGHVDWLTYQPTDKVASVQDKLAVAKRGRKAELIFSLLGITLAAVATALTFWGDAEIGYWLRLAAFIWLLIALPARFIHGTWRKNLHVREWAKYLGEQLTVAAVALIIWLLGGREGLSFHLEALGILAMYTVWHMILLCVVGHTEGPLLKMAAVLPTMAERLYNEEINAMPVGDVSPHDRIRVPAGARVPVDGRIDEGTTTIDAGAVTGEIELRSATLGDAVYAGFLNKGPDIVVEALRWGDSSAVLRALAQTPERPKARALSETRRERALRVCGTGLSVIALGLLIPVALGMPAQEWVLRMCMVLITSGMGMALYAQAALETVALRTCARRGIVTNLPSLNGMTQVQNVVFEKSGVITERKYTVGNVMYVQEYTRSDVLGTAAIAEAKSRHPIARAILQANGGSPPLRDISHFEEFPGEGVYCRYLGRNIAVGNAKLLERLEVTSNGLGSGTVLSVLVDREYIGALLMENNARDDAAECVGALKRMGVRRTLLLSGDSRESTLSVAFAAGVDAHAGALSAAQQLERLKDCQGMTACVGDGFSGSKLVAESDLGITMDGVPVSPLDARSVGIEIISSMLRRISDARQIGHTLARLGDMQNIALVLVKIAALVAGMLTGRVWPVVAGEFALVLLWSGMVGQLASLGKPDKSPLAKIKGKEFTGVHPAAPPAPNPALTGDDIPDLPPVLSRMSESQRQLYVDEGLLSAEGLVPAEGADESGENDIPDMLPNSDYADRADEGDTETTRREDDEA